MIVTLIRSNFTVRRRRVWVFQEEGWRGGACLLAVAEVLAVLHWDCAALPRSPSLLGRVELRVGWLASSRTYLRLQVRLHQYGRDCGDLVDARGWGIS